MTLATGTKLGRYEIRSKIGEGGMGEVYRARDTKLNRDVAVKVLPSAFSADADRLRRFEQEAQAASALNHSNILAVFDFGEHEGAPYVVAELLEGETLRDRMFAGALPARTATEYASQIAQGLAAAHGRGIVHRDLKPENIFLTQQGGLKILDFGLAKLIEPIASGEAQTDVPTRRVNTGAGTTVGTVGYMSPEQVRAERVDHRSDIFSFGVVLYEMLAGQRAFRSGSAVETLSAILEKEPTELSQLNPNIPPSLERVVQRCLEKKPERRFQSASDLAFALESLSGATRSAPVLQTDSTSKRWFTREHFAWLLAGALLLTTLALLFFYPRPARVDGYASQFLIYPPEQASFAAWDLPFPVTISPDGRQLALVLNTEGQSKIWLRRLDSLSAQPLDNTEGAQNPFWSPDGRFIGFFAGGKLKKIAVAGGVPSVLCDAPPNTNSGTWNAADIILFTSGQIDRGIMSVNATGGEVREITKPDSSRNEIYHFWPQFLPDGRHFLFLKGTQRRDDSAIYVGSLDGGEHKRLLPASSRVMYAPPGYLLYLREGALLAVPFNAASLAVTGEQITAAEKVGNFRSTGNAYFSVSGNGDVLAYLPGSNNSRLVWKNRSGVEEETIGPPNVYLGPRLSPDGQKVAVDIFNPKDGTNDIWIYDLPRATFTRFTFEPGLENSPLWSPDGQTIVYARDRDGAPHLFMKRVSDSGEGEMLLPSGEGPQGPYDWSPDGQSLIYRSVSLQTKADIFVLPLTGERKPVPFVQTPFNEYDARLSPDGKWLAYVSDQSGRREVYVDRFPGGGQRSQISNSGGRAPRWHPNGRELFYLADQKLMALPVKSGDKFEAGTATALFSAQARSGDYEVSADGRRFLVNTNTGVPVLPLTVSTNWTINLKR